MTAKKSESVNTEALEKFFTRLFGASVVIFTIIYMGIKKVKWKDSGIYIYHILPMIFVTGIYVMHHRYLKILGELAPNFFTPWKIEKLMMLHWSVHLVFILLVFNGITLLVFGIKSFKEKNTFQEAIDDLGLKTGTGKRPKVLSIYDREEFKKTVVIRSSGLGPAHYESKREDLQSSIDWKIDTIKRSKKNNQRVEINLTEKELPTTIEFNELIPEVKRPYQFVIGESLSGPVVANLEELPHLLIAGATGGGKSVFLNSVLMALLRSDHLQVYGIDLKLVELSLYKPFPNFHVDVELNEAVQTLREVESEMDRRYKKILGTKGHRKMIPKRDNLDRIVVVVDECSDLYGKVPRSDPDYELITESKSITNRIARKGRAAGIHLILATQRASVDTLDSRILSNIPAKVCFKMATAPNSVLILNNKCAFELPETKGRAYWQFGITLTQIQAPLIDEKEVKQEAELAKFEYEENKKLKMVGKMITEKIETKTGANRRYQGKDAKKEEKSNS